MSGSDVLAEAIDPASDRSIYKQIADHLRSAIERGRLRAGDRLPSEAELARHYGVTHMTARSALKILQSEGLAVAEHGRGVYVRAVPPVRRLASDRFAARHRKEGKAAFTVEAEQAGAAPGVDMIKVSKARPPADIADRLKLDKDAPVVVRSRRYSLDGRPVETAVSYIPADLAEGTPVADPNPGPGGIYARLEESGHTLERFTEEVTTRMPTPAEARVLAMLPGVPVFRLVRTAYDAEGRAVEVCDTIMSGDAYLLAYDLPAH
jgi:GntR family transcriptional regulator